MHASYDLVIRGGSIVDGLAGDPFVGDVAISADRIVAVGKFKGGGAEEIQANGLLVTPGFVDIHTHYDGQVIWENRLSPSSAHGVTTVLMGNCGVGFAPCRAQDRLRLIELMEGVEDIPGAVMAEGLTWNWESYGEFLDAVEARPHDINVASYLPHSPLRVYVMGERAVAGERATDADIVRMAELTRDAMRAGALGFSSSRTLFHRSKTGDTIPTLDAGEEELLAISQAIRASGDGILQIVSDYKNMTDIEGEFALLKRVAQKAGRLLTLPIAQLHSAPEAWREVMARIEAANAEGMQITAQVLPRGTGLLFGLDLSMHPFILSPSYQAIQHLPLAERVARMRDPELAACIIAEPPRGPMHPLQEPMRRFEGMFEVGDALDYEPPLHSSIAARAARAGATAEQLAYELLLAHSDQAALYMPFANYAAGNLDTVMELMRHKDVVPGLGDGGAHYGVICDASYSTFMLSHWTRDRQRGEWFTVPQVVRAMACSTASMIGLHDRGVLAPGYKADINIIDYDRLRLHPPKIAFDLPAGGRRLTQRAEGYVATIVNGTVVYREGIATGALPGRLVRGQQSVPTTRKQNASADV